MFLMKFIAHAIKFVLALEVVQALIKALTPERYYCWKTFCWLSIFSWLTAALATGLVSRVIYICGWSLFIASIDWAAREEKIPLRPWLTAALICIFVFDVITGQVPKQAIVFWPPVAAIVAALPSFFNKQLYLKLPSEKERQKLLVLVLSQVLLSCWLQFAILTQNLMANYPSLLAEDISESNFLVKFEGIIQAKPKGVDIINGLKDELNDELGKQPWSEVKAWFSTPRLPEAVQVMSDEVKEQVLPVVNNNLLGQEKSERDLWEIQADARQTAAGYNLKLKAVWNGPRSQTEEYYVEQSCSISPVLVYSPNKDSIKFSCQEMKIEGWPQKDPQKESFISQGD